MYQFDVSFLVFKHGSLNGYHKTHALRERARKLSQGILIIRSVLINMDICVASLTCRLDMMQIQIKKINT